MRPDHSVFMNRRFGVTRRIISRTSGSPELENGSTSQASGPLAHFVPFAAHGATALRLFVEAELPLRRETTPRAVHRPQAPPEMVSQSRRGFSTYSPSYLAGGEPAQDRLITHWSGTGTDDNYRLHLTGASNANFVWFRSDATSRGVASDLRSSMVYNFVLTRSADRR